MTITEEQLVNARRALGAATHAHRRGATSELDVVGALDELRAWVDDDREAGNLLAIHWASLLDDVLWTLKQCGQRLTDHLLADDHGIVHELSACRILMKNTKGSPDRAMRRRTAIATERIQSRLLSRDALQASLEDVIDAATPDAADRLASLLVAIAAGVGHEPQWFPSRLGSVLADNAFEIAAARGDDLPASGPRDVAGASLDERVALAKQLTQEVPARADVVIWLRFRHAELGWPPTLELGEHVTLFDDEWLRAVIANDPVQLTALAPDIAAASEHHSIRNLLGVDGEPESPRRAERSVFVRVLVTSATMAEAVQLARRTADAVAGLASLYGTRPRLWQLDNSYISTVGNHEGSSSYSASPNTALDIDDEVALANDHTGRELANLAPRLGPHLPVRDPTLLHAATLLSWLRSARASEPAPRVLLCSRVVEQVTGWAGFGEPRSFTTEILRPAWVVSRLRNVIANAAFAASYELRRRGRGEIADSFAEPEAGWGGTVNLKAFIERFDDVLIALGDDQQNAQEVFDLVPRLRNASTAAAWLKSETKEFERHEARRRRTRNSLIHGGPLAPRTVGAVAEFAESTAVLALGDCIEGRLSDKNLVDYFLEQRVSREGVQRRLEAGKPLSEALFWGTSS